MDDMKMTALPLDVSCALRGLRRSPGFAIVASLSLAFGIGANGAMFSVLDALLWRRLPVRQPTQLVLLTTLHTSGRELGLSVPIVQRLAAMQRTFSAILGSAETSAIVESGQTVARGTLLAVTGNFFEELGARPVVGRLFGGDWEFATFHTDPVAVIGQRMWERDFGGNPAIVGQVVSVKGVPLTVVGVAPRGFKGLSVINEPDVLVPLSTLGLLVRRDAAQLNDPTLYWVNVAARLKEGVSLQAARSAMDGLWPIVQQAIAPSVASSRQSEFRSVRLRVTSGARGSEPYVRARFTRPLYLVTGISALTLLIACVNVAGLMVSRASARADEWRTRLALGAHGWHLVRQALVEGSVVALAGASLGLAIGAWSSQVLVKLMLQDYPPSATLQVGLDSRVLAFTGGVTLLAALLFSVTPVWAVIRHRRWTPGPRGATVVRGIPKVGSGLVVVQVALSLVLLMGAGLLTRSLRQLAAVDIGYRSSDVVVANLSPRSGGYRSVDGDRYYPDLLQRVMALPGVKVAALSHYSPAAGGGSGDRIADTLRPRSDDAVEGRVALVSAGFFEAIDLRLVDGRALSIEDGTRSRRVAVVSASLADALFAGRRAVGQHVRIGDRPERQRIEVVGVAADARLYDVRDPNTYLVYLPHLQEGEAGFYNTLLARMEPGAPPPSREIARVVASLGVEDVTWVRSLEEMQARAMLRESVTARVAACFGLLALGLAAVGVYGLMSHTVTLRRPELAIRAAIGASRAALLRTTMGRALVLLVIGLGAGVPLALFASRFVASLLFELQPDDPATLMAVAGILLGVGVVAAYVPSRTVCESPPAETLHV